MIINEMYIIYATWSTRDLIKFQASKMNPTQKGVFHAKTKRKFKILRTAKFYV